MAKSLKQTLVSIPGLGYAFRVTSNVVYLPKTRARLVEAVEQATRQLQELEKAQAALEKSHTEHTNKVTEENNRLADKIAGLQVTQDDLLKELDGHSKQDKQSDDELFADDHIMDNFYTGFEDRFRGSEELITERLKEYLPYFKNSPVNLKKYPVLDIGSGRGEMLGLLKQNGYNALGIDINFDMVKRSNKKGLKAIQGDALNYLQESKAQTIGAITGFHIVEHIPFNILLRIFDNAHRALTDNGFVIFETPNPENLTVGSTSFYMDPSHLHPLPPVLLAFALETCGFKRVEIKRLHPDDDKKIGKLPADVSNLLYGPRDYAVIGYK